MGSMGFALERVPPIAPPPKILAVATLFPIPAPDPHRLNSFFGERKGECEARLGTL
jgi:hypothetical protein